MTKHHQEDVIRGKEVRYHTWPDWVAANGERDGWYRFTPLDEPYRGVSICHFLVPYKIPPVDPDLDEPVGRHATAYPKKTPVGQVRFLDRALAPPAGWYKRAYSDTDRCNRWVLLDV